MIVDHQGGQQRAETLRDAINANRAKESLPFSDP
jgi:hypothetical protein